jgi:uncharacterized RDD family membrane protein YckC
MSEKLFAGFWLRLAAYLIDSIVLQLVQSMLVAPFLISLGIVFASEPFDFAAYEIYGDEFANDFWEYVEAAGPLLMAGFIAQVLYFALLESSYLQASLGKMIVGIKVCDLKGERLTFLFSLIRNLAKFVSSLLLMMGYVMAAFTQKRQALHDIIAGTLVVRKGITTKR